MKNLEKLPILTDLPEKIFHVLFVLGSIFWVTSEISAQQFPYEATVCEAEAFVRSGAGKDFYATDRLQNGDKVQVFKHTADGWCAIRPPVGSFSWVSARYVQMAQNDLGQIIGKSVPVYVGSRLSPDRSQVQISLNAGKVVEVLEAPTDNALEALCRISPPSGEFRWIHGSYLSPNHTGITEEPEPPVRSVLGDLSGSNGSAPLGIAANGSGALTPGSDPNSGIGELPGPDSFLYFVNQLDADLSYIIANGNSAQWETEALLMRANRLMNYASTSAERCAGTAGRNKGIALSFRQHPKTYHHRRILLFPYSLRRVIVHIHNIIGIGDLNTVRQIGNAVFLQHIQNLLSPSYQCDLGAVFLRCLQSSHNRCFRGVIATHSIKNDLHLTHLPLFRSTDQ